MAECKVVKCTCNNESQDAIYGPKMRVYNPAGKGKQDEGYRCTVCGNTLGKTPRSLTKRERVLQGKQSRH